MKSQDDLFSEKMPSDLQSKILSQADVHLGENRKMHRRTLFNWVFGAGFAALAASVSFIFVKQSVSNSEQQAELAQAADIFGDLLSDDDFDMIADYELMDDLELIEQLDDV